MVQSAQFAEDGVLGISDPAREWALVISYSSIKKYTTMRKIILSMHVSLDGFVGGPNGEMDWIHIDGSIFDFTGKMTDEANGKL